MTKFSKLTRRQLAMRLLAVLALVNGFVLLMMSPSSAEKPTVISAPKGSVELRIKAGLYTSADPGVTILLGHPEGKMVGPVTLLRQEDETLVVAIPTSLYRLHHAQLAMDNWAALPYVEGIGAKPAPSRGGQYEISY